MHGHLMRERISNSLIPLLLADIWESSRVWPQISAIEGLGERWYPINGFRVQCMAIGQSISSWKGLFFCRTFTATKLLKAGSAEVLAGVPPVSFLVSVELAHVVRLRRRS